MFYATSFKRLFTLFFLGLVFTILGSCSSSSTPGSSNTGTVALLMTDAPSDIFEEINITVTRAELLSDSGAVTIFQGNRTFNLLDLTDARIFAIREGIAAGTYSKIRLTLSEIELVDYHGPGTADDEYFYPKLPGNGKLDLNPRGDFDVVAGGTLAIQIDMDGNKSIHIVKKGKKDEYNFRPVVFITILTDAFTERYVKLYGDVEAIDSTDQSFNLCNTNIPVQIDDGTMDDSSRGCLRVTTDASTSIFDIDGMPAGFIDLVAGEPATVFGYLQYVASSNIDTSVASATTTAAAKKSKDKDHDDDEDYDKDDDYDHDDNGLELRDLVLKAKLIELGPEGGFLKLKGTADSTVNVDDQFTMEVDPGQGLSTTTPPLIINVQIQDGTIVVNRQGVPVATAVIDTDKLTVRGVYYVDTNTLYASLIIVDTDSSTELTGDVVANPDTNCGFTISTADGDRSIATDSDTRAYLVVDGDSDPINIGDLTTANRVDAYGDENINGCFDAHTIIAYPIPAI
jgi:hypothetical protein